MQRSKWRKEHGGERFEHTLARKVMDVLSNPEHPRWLDTLKLILPLDNAYQDAIAASAKPAIEAIAPRIVIMGANTVTAQVEQPEPARDEPYPARVVDVSARVVEAEHGTDAPGTSTARTSDTARDNGASDTTAQVAALAAQVQALTALVAQLVQRGAGAGAE